MTSSKLRIKDDLYNRLSPVQSDEMLYKETTKTRSSYGYDHQDSCERPLRYAEECPTQTKFSTKHLPNTSSHLHHDADDDDGDEDDDTTDTEMPPKSAFILRAQFYQNLFAASANLLKKQRPTKRHRVPAPAPDGFEADASGDDAGIDEKAEDLSSPLETALAGVGQLQKCLFPSAPAPHGRQESNGGNGAAPEVGCDVDTADEMLEVSLRLLWFPKTMMPVGYNCSTIVEFLSINKCFVFGSFLRVFFLLHFIDKREKQIKSVHCEIHL